MPVHPSAAGLLLAALALSACENIPYYNESLNFFSRSQYDPEVKAIEEQTSPPQDSPVLAAPTGPAAMTEPTSGGAILAVASPDLRDDSPTTPMPVISAQGGIEGEAAARDQAVSQASLPQPTRIMPPMGLGRSKRVIYATNRGPFQAGNVRTLR